jgi:hypothetical protein
MDCCGATKLIAASAYKTWAGGGNRFKNGIMEAVE